MERDFLGLRAKQPRVVVKEEVHTDGYKERGFTKGPMTQWPFTNKVSALPHLMPFEAAQDGKTKKISSDNLMSPVFMATSTADGYHPGQTLSGAENRNLAGRGMKSQLLGGVPVTTLHSIVPTIDSVNGITEPRSVKVFNTTTQLTIFYAGTVNVFDGVSPEKAQAIMLLAGNGLCMGQPQIQVQAPISTPGADTGAHSGSGSTAAEEIKPATVTVVEPPNTLKTMGSVAATTMIASAVPQARKASLARFLEKRRERVLNAAPYNLASNSPELLASHESLNFSASSAARTASHLATKGVD